MKLTFDTLTPENFGCFYEPVTLDFSLLSAGLYFLTGRNEKHPRLETNGVGKTTLWRALIWALYGRTPNGLRGPDLQSWRGKKTTAVTVQFRCDDDEHELTRQHSPNKITLNGKPVEQQDVDALIGGMSMETFCNAIIFPQREDLFLDRTPGDKLKLLTDALNLERWTQRAERAGKLASGLANEESDLLGRWNSLTGQIEQAEGLLKDAKARSEDWEADRRQRLADKAERKAKLAAELDTTEKLLGDAQLERDSVGVDVQETRRLLAQARAEADTVHKAFVVAGERQRALNDEADRLGRELKRLGETDECPTCGQSVCGTDLESHRREILARVAQIKGETKKLAYGLLHDRDQQTRNKVTRIDSELEDAEALADKLEARVNVFLPQVAELRTKLQALRDATEEQQDESNPHTEEVHKLRRQVSQLTVQADDVQADIADVRNELERARYWIKGFKDVQLYIIEELLQDVEAACNAMLPDVGLDGWQIMFHVEHENKSGGTTRGLHVSILSPDYDKPVRWECWSGGEGQRLRVIAALGLAEVLLAECGVQSNIEVLDEPTQHMSQSGTRDLCGFLSDRARDLGVQTFWVDHSVVESNRFEATLTIVKDSEGSYIETR